MARDIAAFSCAQMAAAVAAPSVLGAVLLAWALAGPGEGISVLIGGAMVVLFFASGVLVQRLCMTMANARGLLLNLVGYLLRLGVLWAIGTALTTQPVLGRGLSTSLLGVGAVVGVSGWIAGMLSGHYRARIPVYDRQYTAPKGWET